MAATMLRLEDVLSAKFGYDIDPVKTEQHRRRYGTGETEPTPDDYRPLRERPNRSGPDD